jgi:hypothetical protein
MTITKVLSGKLISIGLFFMLANALLWIIFWGGFFSESFPYPKPQTPGEGAYVTEVVAHRAISPEKPLNLRTFYRMALIADLPAFVVTRVAINLPTAGYRSPVLHSGTTVAGYELICWMVVSFLQWYLISRLLSWLMSTIRRRAGGSDSNTIRGLRL